MSSKVRIHRDSWFILSCGEKIHETFSKPLGLKSIIYFLSFNQLVRALLCLLNNIYFFLHTQREKAPVTYDFPRSEYDVAVAWRLCVSVHSGLSWLECVNEVGTRFEIVEFAWSCSTVERWENQQKYIADIFVCHGKSNLVTNLYFPISFSFIRSVLGFIPPCDERVFPLQTSVRWLSCARDLRIFIVCRFELANE